MARVVVVEDSPQSLELVKSLLEAAGHTVFPADDGFTGLELIRSERPDLVLSDINLPGIDGRSLLAAIRSDPQLHNARVLAHTAFATRGDREAALNAGFDGYISKPIDPDTFTSAVEAYLPLALRGRQRPASSPQPDRATPVTIGVITPYLGRWYFMKVFAGIEDSLRSFDVNILMHTVSADGLPATNTQSAVERMRGRVHGIVVVSLTVDDPALHGVFELGVPIVMLGSRPDGLPSVSIDDRHGAMLAVEHLIAQGHRRIGLIGGEELPSRFVPENDRLRGYLDALDAHGLDSDHELRRTGGFTIAGGALAMEGLLDLYDPPSAVFCMSDEMAYGALRVLSRRGLEPGRDVGVIGYDGHDLAESFDLSTIAQPVERLGRTAARMLMSELVNQVRGTAVVQDVVLIARNSTDGWTGGKSEQRGTDTFVNAPWTDAFAAQRTGILPGR